MKSTSNRRISHSSCLPLLLHGLPMLLMRQWYQVLTSASAVSVYVPFLLMARRVLTLYGQSIRLLLTTSHWAMSLLTVLLSSQTKSSHSSILMTWFLLLSHGSWRMRLLVLLLLRAKAVQVLSLLFQQRVHTTSLLWIATVRKASFVVR